MNQKNMNHMRRILKRAQTLRAKHDALETALAEIKVLLADAGVEYADLQKEISDDLFGDSITLSEAELQNELLRTKKRRRAKKKTTKRRAAKKVQKKAQKRKSVTGTREQIQAAAKKRDEKLLSVLRRSKKPMTIDELHRAINNGSLKQMRGALKRVRKQLKTVGYARHTKYFLKRK